MLSPMRRRTARPVPDIFSTFAHRVDTEDSAGFEAPRATTVARSAGITVGLMVLTSLAFVMGAWLAGEVQPDLVYSNLFWEGVAITVWSLAWGTLAALVVLSGAVVAVGVPWARRQRDARATSTSTP